MRRITIDCGAVTSRQALHQALCEALCFPEHYGGNLDALHDCLTGICEPTTLFLQNWPALEENLGSYARNARRAILSAGVENASLCVLFD